MSENGNNKLINVVVDFRKWVEMSLIIEMMPQLAGLSIFPKIELDEYLDDIVSGIYHMIVDDLITPLLKSNNLSKSFGEIVPLYSMLARSYEIIIITHYEPTELEEIFIRGYKELQKELIKLEPYLAENVVSILAGLDAQFEHGIGMLEILQKNQKFILEIQLQQYLDLLTIISSLSLCLLSTILVAQDRVNISDIKIQNLRTLAQWSESYASQLMVKSQKLGLTDGTKLINYLGIRNKISDILREL